MTNSGLWNEGFGAVGATLKALQDAGVTLEQLGLIRSNPTLAKSVAELLASASKNRYADEEVASSYTYHPAYKQEPLDEQIKIIAKAFGLDPASAYAYAETVDGKTLPEGAEGWFAIPLWSAIAPTYGEAVEKVLGLLADNRTLHNYRDGKLDASYLRQSQASIDAWAKLSATQDGDILIIPAQFGLRHRGKSIRRARVTFGDNEFGLGAFAIGCMLLTHPAREVEWEQLHIDCAGDEYSPDADGQFGGSLDFYFDVGRLKFDSRWVCSAYEPCGSVSGFLPQD